MIPLNYHHLYYFWTVARAGSIAAATQRLYLSQPALSGQLKELEKSCKARLLERGRKGVTLTHEGRLVFERCERIFTEGDELAAMIKGGFQVPAVLRVGVEATISREVVLRMLDFAKAAAPDCRVVIFAGQTASLRERLKTQVHELIVTPDEEPEPLGREFRSRVVARLPVDFLAGRGLAKELKRFPARAAGVPLLLRPPGNSVRQQVDAYLAEHEIEGRVEAASQDVELLKRLAMDGRGVTGLCSLAAEEELSSGRLVRLNKARTGIVEAVTFSCGPHPRTQPVVRALIDALMSKFSLA